ncbi:Isochorismatase [Baekduia alba]|uniref:isochorismatase family protein n=1 Tax=Baekduia alba TaxID=2997333 RepID=UPI002341FACA|nr:isochorismatase family protein [Baekduia alba]WCB95229.1 Isochorismatase [Baekduia alba]
MTLPRITPYPMPTATELPANRVDWRPAADRCALLIHDMQHHFLAAFDRGAEPIPELLSNIAALRDRCAQLGIPVIYSAQPGGQTLEQRGLLQDFWGDGIAAGPAGQAIVDELAPRPGDVRLTKWRYSAFVRTELDAVLREQGRDQLLVVGIYGHIGCLMTACHAFMQEVEPFLVADAIADFSQDDHRMALAWGAQRCAVVTTTGAVLDAVAAAGAGLTRADVAADLLGAVEDPPAVLDGATDLMDLGLDSIMVMSLLTRWRERGADVSFEDLAEIEPTLDAWWAVVAAAQRRRAPSVAA